MKPEDIGTYYESILDKEVRKVGGVYYTPPLIVEPFMPLLWEFGTFLPNFVGTAMLREVR